MAKVLIVDDQPAVRGALQLLFDVNEIPSMAASTPLEALQLVRTEDVGLVVLDMNFSQHETSGREGTELFRSLRSLEPALPVLLMTAWASLESAVALVKEGASDYFAKPWEDARLLRTVRNLLELRRLHDENVRLLAQTRRAREELRGQYDLRELSCT